MYNSFLEPFQSSVSYSHLNFDRAGSNMAVLPCTTFPVSIPHRDDGLPNQFPRHAVFFGGPGNKDSAQKTNTSALGYMGFYRKL